MFVVLVVVLLSGFVPSVLRLSDKVLITLLTTTTANVLGLMVIVLKGVFDVKDEKPDDEKPAHHRGSPRD